MLRSLQEILDESHSLLAAGETVPVELETQLKEAWTRERPGQAQALSDLLTWMGEAAANAKPPGHQPDLGGPGVPAMVEVSESEVRPARSRSYAVAGAAGGVVFPVFFGTNRRALEGCRPESRLSSQRGAKTLYGQCKVFVPRAHRFGELGSSWWQRLLRLDLSDDRLKLTETKILGSKNFWRRVQRKKGSGGDHGLIFLHGYNVSFEEAAIRTAQLGCDLQVSGPTAFFSWPSQGNPLRYAADIASIESSEAAIESFLTDFLQHSAAEKVHLIAHSMGNRGLLRSLQRMATNTESMLGAKFGQIFLAAPDIDRGLFLNLASLYPLFSERTTLYASKHDVAVGLSSRLHGSPRAGYFSDLVPVTVAQDVKRVDTIVVPNFEVDLLGHSYFAKAEALLYDMFELIRRGSPPSQRLRLKQRGDHWIFVL